MGRQVFRHQLVAYSIATPPGINATGRPVGPIPASRIRLDIKVSLPARTPGLVRLPRDAPLSGKLDARALDFAPLLAEPREQWPTNRTTDLWWP
jgi:hypothetical protein